MQCDPDTGSKQKKRVVKGELNTDLINTGVLSGQQSATSMRIFTASLGGIIRDVTARSHCISAEPRVLKTSPTCTSVYVDGSELRGMQNMKVHVHYEKWTAFIAFTVWAIVTTKELLNNLLAEIVFQQTELRVFASFQVSDERTGERMYLSGHRDILFDITSLAADSIVSADRSIATVRNYKSRVIVQAVQPGETRIVIKAQTPNIDFGSTTVVVSAETVALTRMTALPIVEMNINIEPTAGKRAQYDVVTMLETTFQHRYQLFLSTILLRRQYGISGRHTVTDFTLTSQSSDERVIALAHKVQNGIDMIALDDLSDPFIQLELRPPAHCTDADVAPLAMLQVPMRVQFDGHGRQRVWRLLGILHKRQPHLHRPETTSIWRMDSLLPMILVLILFGGVVKFFSKRASSFRGYVKLIQPRLPALRDPNYF
ncbi:hypothetical protein COOONC_07050 [Cooperia oncophora]